MSWPAWLTHPASSIQHGACPMHPLPASSGLQQPLRSLPQHLGPCAACSHLDGTRSDIHRCITAARHSILGNAAAAGTLRQRLACTYAAECSSTAAAAWQGESAREAAARWQQQRCEPPELRGGDDHLGELGVQRVLRHDVAHLRRRARRGHDRRSAGPMWGGFLPAAPSG